jgi:hypothetical protein
MASKVKSHLPQPKQQSKPVPSVEWSNHLGSFKQFKDARREWRGLCDGDSRWSKKCSMAPRTEFVRIVERMDELATQIVQSAYGGDLGFDGKLDVAVFRCPVRSRIRRATLLALVHGISQLEGERARMDSGGCSLELLRIVRARDHYSTSKASELLHQQTVVR